jgi:hypothetical protein
MNGWHKDIHTYEGTALIRDALIDLKYRGEGCAGHETKFRRTGLQTWQQINVRCSASHVYLYITSTYKPIGERICAYPSKDTGVSQCLDLTGISEIKFYYSPDILSAIPWHT